MRHRIQRLTARQTLREIDIYQRWLARRTMFDGTELAVPFADASTDTLARWEGMLLGHLIRSTLGALRPDPRFAGRWDAVVSALMDELRHELDTRGWWPD